MKTLRNIALTLSLLLVSGAPLVAQNLRGSSSSLDRQNHQAHRHDFTYLRTPRDVKSFVQAGYLVRVPGNADYRLHNVSFPYARPEARLFIERLSAQYRSACGEQLVVTSLIRPATYQARLRNGSDRSVHPTGMAIDLRYPRKASCRRWLESTLLYLEGRNVIEATRERRPPHYHLAVFPEPYARYVRSVGGTTKRPAKSGTKLAEAAPSAASGPTVEYRVRAGDSLWSIARAHSTSVDQIRALNTLSGNQIYAGMRLKLPAR